MSDLFAPVGGEVVATNDALTGRPSSSTATPTATAGWSGSASPMRRSWTASWTPDAYDALIAAG